LKNNLLYPFSIKKKTFFTLSGENHVPKRERQSKVDMCVGYLDPSSLDVTVNQSAADFLGCLGKGFSISASF